MMKRLLRAAILVSCLSPVPVLAQQSTIPPGSLAEPSQFVPFVIDEGNANELRNYLNQQPYMFAAPLVRWLDNSIAKARAESAAKARAADEAKKKEPATTPPDTAPQQ